MNDQPSKPHYHGHRQRLKNRFLEKGSDTLLDYELVELLLFYAIPRGDVKPIAKDLLANFDNDTSKLFSASIEELEKINGIGQSSAQLIKVIQAISLRIQHSEIIDQPIMNSWKKVVQYCEAKMANEKNEQFRLLFLNKQLRLIGEELQQTGTIDQTPVYTREVIKRALEIGAAGIILVHNHPSGDPTPSDADISLTKKIQKAGKPLNIEIYDHLIVAKKGCKSLRSMGLL